MGGVTAAVVAGGCGGGSKPTTSVQATTPVNSLPAFGQVAKTAKETAKEVEAANLPPPIRPVLPNPLSGEGVWKPTGPPVNGGPPVLVTT